MGRKPKPRPPGFLVAIESAGARAELDALLAEFIVANHDEAKDLLLKAIDQDGLRSDGTMLAVSTLQRKLWVKPTLYTKLVQLAAAHGLKPTVPESTRRLEEAKKRKMKPKTVPGVPRHRGM